MGPTTDSATRRRSGSAVIATLFASVFLFAGSLPAHAATFIAEEAETHCVIDVLDVLLDGEFVVSEPVCFSSFDEAMAFVGLGSVKTGSSLLKQRPNLSAPTSRAVGGNTTNGSSNYVIGIHFTGRGGTGSSITVAGSSCSGGFWNASSSWRNVISSSYNGCARLAHYSELYVSGSRYDTRTVGQTDSIYGSMDNSTKSISYHSS